MLNHKIFLIVIVGFIFSSTIISMNVSANVVDDVVSWLNNALFDGDISMIPATESILSAVILFLIGISLAYLKFSVVGISIVLFPAMGVLIVIGWLEIWVLLFTGLLIAGLFGKRIAEWVTSVREGF